MADNISYDTDEKMADAHSMKPAEFKEKYGEPAYMIKGRAVTGKLKKQPESEKKWFK